MSLLCKRARNIGRRTPNAQLVHDHRLNRTVEEHSRENLYVRYQIACTSANENSEQRNQRLRANTLNNERHVDKRPTQTENVLNGECTIIEHGHEHHLIVSRLNMTLK